MRTTNHEQHPDQHPALSQRQKLLLRVLDRKQGFTVVQITDLLKPYYPPARPVSQLSVREALRPLLAMALVAVSNTGKPRTYVRTGRRPQTPATT